MTTFRITSPDGTVYRITAPEGATEQEALERVQFQHENDKPRPNTSKPAVVSAGETIRAIPRQLGMAVRHGAEGLAQFADIVAEPIAGTYNTVANLIGAGGPRFPSGPTYTATRGVLDLLGAPTPANETERVVGDASRMVAGSMGLSGVASKLAGFAPKAAEKVVTSLASNPGQQAVSAASGGAAGGAVREAGGGPVEQFGAAVAGSLTGAGLSDLGVKLYDGINKAVLNWRAPQNTTTQVNIVINQILESNGIKTGQIPGDVRAALAKEVKEALDTGKQVNPDVVRRIADYGVVGARPTRGNVTLDPVQITRERNLAKLGANSQDTALQELARNQNRNNATLIDNLNEMGGATANANPVTAGKVPLAFLRAQDEEASKAVTKLYNAYKEAGGEYSNVPQTKLTEALGRVMDDGLFDALPPAVVNRLKEFGFLDSNVTRNLTIKEADLFNKVLNNNNPGFGPASKGIAVLKSALNDSMLDVPTAGLKSSESLMAARKAAAARFADQRSSAGVAAAIEGVEPDRFIRDFIIGSGPKGATAEVEKLLFKLKDDPASMQAVKENVVAYLKQAALGKGAADEMANFSPSNYNRALSDIGDLKLRLFFNKDEIAQLKAVGRVAGYETFQPRGSAVNNSNTASAFASVLEKIASSPLVSRIPFGESAIRQPAQNWAAQIATKTATDPYGVIANTPQRPPGTALERLLGPGLLLTAPRAESGDKDKSR